MTDFSSLFPVVATLSWKAALLIAAFFILRFFIGKKIPPAWRFNFWLVAAIPLLIHVSYPFSWSIFQVLPSGSQFLDFNVSFSHPVIADDSGLSNHEEYLSWATLLTWVWLAGCLLMLAVFARQIRACRKWIRQSIPVTSPKALAVFDDCRRRMCVKTTVHVAEGPGISGPFLFGGIRYVLLLPQGVAGTASEDQLKTIFLHELAHMKRRDVWTSWLMSALLTIHWFNPFLWLAIRRMNSDREEACDLMALETLSLRERIEYGRALLDIAEQFLTTRKAPGLVGIAETLGQMSGRIEMIKRVGIWKWRWTVLTAGLFFLVALFIMTDPPKDNGVLYSSCGFPRSESPQYCSPKDCAIRLCIPCVPCSDVTLCEKYCVEK